jgi:hypothetical protein
MPVILATWEEENCGSRPAQAKSLRDPISINDWLWWHVLSFPEI